ncbi:MAG: sensor histidine kinase [Panacagrimonas sp.]
MTSHPPAAPAPEDWRALRLLSFYRLALVALFLGLIWAESTPQVWFATHPQGYLATCQVYAGISLLLVWMAGRRKPDLTFQAHIHYLADLAAIAVLVYETGGVNNGLGTLLLIPAVTCALILNSRMALLQAAIGTLTMFGEELLRQYGQPLDASGFTSTGVLGLILFGTAIAANTVAQRARKSEALAQRMGSEFDNLSRLNEVILESMHTGLVVVDENLRIRNINAAARDLMRATPLAEGQELRSECPALGARVQEWLKSGEADAQPIPLGPNLPEAIVRISRLGETQQGPIMVALEDASRLHEQAQQIKLASLGRLSASIAHEIRNPLAAISHAGQLLYEAPEIGPENRSLLAMIHRHSDRIDKIVEDVMTLSRREAAKPLAIPLALWLEDTVALYAEGHRQAPRPIEVGEIPAGAGVHFDPRHLQQLMFNLWDNAFRHGAREGTPIFVRISGGVERGGRPWLDIVDNGPGVSRDMIDRIFEPFFTTAQGGTGLGLYLARELCEFNQARLSYQHRMIGACFRVTFTPSTQRDRARILERVAQTR